MTPLVGTIFFFRERNDIMTCYEDLNLEYAISNRDFLDNAYITIRCGKKNYYIGKRG